MASVLGELFRDIADAIRGKTGGTNSMKPLQFPEAISGIEVGADGEEINLLLDEINGEVVGQKLCYVTIMTEDGLAEVLKIPVYEGYDCEDPFTGALGKPTKESTATQTFTYSGLSFTPGGKADELALKNVVDDRTVYLAFKSSTRYYTVRFFDGDTLKNTVRVTYNGTASYTLANKAGFLFRGWIPSGENIIMDTDCYAQWEELTNFADATLARINEICESGHAADHFAVNDEREVIGSDGNTYILRIIGINMDTKQDGSKAGVTVAVAKKNASYSITQKQQIVGKARWTSGSYIGKYWDYTSVETEQSNVRVWMNNTFIDKLPSDLQGIIKTVKKKTAHKDSSAGSITIRESYEQLFAPSLEEVGFKNASYGDEGFGKYPGFDNLVNQWLYDGSVALDWYTRTVEYTGDDGAIILNLVLSGSVTTNSYSTTLRGVFPCFCI